MATLAQTFDPKAANLFSTGMPELVLENGTSIPESGYAFDDTAPEQIFIVLGADFYLSGNLIVDYDWYSRAGNTAGSAVLGVQIAALSAGDAQSVLTDALATAQTTTSLVNSTARGLQRATVTVTNLDSLAIDDRIQMRIYRDAAAGGDTLAGDVIITKIRVAYASTAGAGAGNVSNAGASTDNAIVRFDLTTGQVIQDSVVTIADSTGNMSGVGTLNGKTIADLIEHPTSPVVAGDVPQYTGTSGKVMQSSTKSAASLVVGPATATSGRLAVYNGATGKLLQDGTKLEADVVTGPASVSTLRIATFNGTTGKVIQDSGVAISGGNLSNVAGISMSANITGVTTINASGVVVASGFVGIVGSGNILTATQANSTVALADVTNMTVALPAGVYEFLVEGLWQSAAVTTGLKLSARMATGAGSTYTAACAIVTGAAGATESASQTTFNTVMGSVAGPAAAVSVPFSFWGRFTVGTAGNFAIQFASEVAASAVTLQVGTMLKIIQV